MRLAWGPGEAVYADIVEVVSPLTMYRRGLMATGTVPLHFIVRANYTAFLDRCQARWNKLAMLA